MSETTAEPDETIGADPGAPAADVSTPDVVTADVVTPEVSGAGQSSDISVSGDWVTLINVFTVPTENQARLVQALGRATEEVIRFRPGFVSANIHASLDGTRVTNYAQWASVEDMEAMLASPECQPHLTECSALGEAEPHVYRVSSVHHV